MKSEDMAARLRMLGWIVTAPPADKQPPLKLEVGQLWIAATPDVAPRRIFRIEDGSVIGQRGELHIYYEEGSHFCRACPSRYFLEWAEASGARPSGTENEAVIAG